MEIWACPWCQSRLVRQIRLGSQIVWQCEQCERRHNMDDWIIWSCPWCNSSQVLLVDAEGQWQVECKKCHTSGPVCDKRLIAVRSWNCLAGRIAQARAE